MENIEQLRFKVSQLRQDKIIYAVESVAINTAAIVGMIFAHQYFNKFFEWVSYAFCLFVAAGYTIYTGVTNHKRLQNAKDLEKQIDEKLLRELQKD